MRRVDSAERLHPPEGDARAGRNLQRAGCCGAGRLGAVVVLKRDLWMRRHWKPEELGGYRIEVDEDVGPSRPRVKLALERLRCCELRVKGQARAAHHSGDAQLGQVAEDQLDFACTQRRAQ